MTAKRLLRLELAPDAELLRAVRLLVSAVAADLGFSLDEIDDLKLAVQEACVTRIAGGVARDAVVLTMSTREGALEVAVAGDAPGDATMTEETELGVTLAQALVDEFSILDAGGLQQLVMVKRPSGVPDAEAP